MGLFSRDKAPEKDNDNLFEDRGLPGSDDLNESFLDERAAGEPTIDIPEKRTASAPTPKYGIEEAIALMRKLPKDDAEVVVTVVNKTLESTHIQVADIIQDAAAKETRLREQHKKLETEIKDFQREIERRNQQIAELLTDLKETSEVSQRLQLALELEKKNKPAAKTRTAGTETKAPAGATRTAGSVGQPPLEPGRKPAASVTGAGSQQRPAAAEPPNPKR